MQTVQRDTLDCSTISSRPQGKKTVIGGAGSKTSRVKPCQIEERMNECPSFRSLGSRELCMLLLFRILGTHLLRTNVVSSACSNNHMVGRKTSGHRLKFCT